MIGLIFFCLAPVVHDGDTFRCEQNGARVRIFGVNAPEVGTPGAYQSTQALIAEVRGGVRCQKKGKSYNRVVARCWNSSGKDISEIQLRGGYAVEWCRYSKGLYRTCPN